MTTQTIKIVGSTTLPLDQLRIDDKTNVRKIGRGADAAFIASIKALGIQMPLIVRKNGVGYVVADGGKRLAAAQALAKSGDIAANADIPVIITNATDAAARELSLALNLVRSDMHPVDAFRAFQSLHTDKEKPLEVDALAERFGVSTKIVRQRLALGSLDAVILDAWRDGKIKEDVAQAFTLCPNKKDQARVYAKLMKSTWRDFIEADEVKEELKVNPNDVGKFLNAVGIEAYEARGGKVTRDLFGDDHTVSDETLIKTMIDEKLAATCQSLTSDGWAWATSDVPTNVWAFGTLQGQFKPTPEEKKKLAALAAVMEDDSLDQNKIDAADEEHDELKAAILTRSFTPKQKAKAGCFVRIGHATGMIQIEYGRVVPAKVKVNTTETIDKKTGERIKSTSLGKKKASAGGKKGPATLTKATTDRLREQRETAIKTALVLHPHGASLATVMAAILASQIRPGSFNAAPDSLKSKFEAIIAGIDPKVMNAALRKAFDAKGYFDGAGKTFCLAAVTEAVNADEARKISKGKKAEIAKFAFVNVSKTGWLPKELRCTHYDGPTGKTKAKIKTKAKAKPAPKSKRKVTTKKRK